MLRSPYQQANHITLTLRLFSTAIFTDSEPVELSGRIQVLDSGDLLISNVRETDAGLYSCIRSNEAGTVNGQAYLSVMGKYFVKYSCSLFVHHQFMYVHFCRIEIDYKMSNRFSFLFPVRTQIIQPPADTTVLLGLTASLQCKVSSDPSVPYNIDWYRDTQTAPIMNSQRIGVQADGTLEIQAVRAADVGTYSCMVSFAYL